MMYKTTKAIEEPHRKSMIVNLAPDIKEHTAQIIRTIGDVTAIRR